MHRVQQRIVVVLLLTGSALVAQAAQPELRAIAEGVYVALQPAAGRFNDSNTAVLVDARGVVVVDSQADEAWNRAVIDAIRTLTDKPVRVPGHGRIFEGRDQLQVIRRLLQRAVDGATAAVAAGRTLEQLQEELDWSDLHQALVGEDEVAGRAFDSFVPDLVKRAFAEASGQLDNAEGS